MPSGLVGVYATDSYSQPFYPAGTPKPPVPHKTTPLPRPAEAAHLDTVKPVAVMAPITPTRTADPLSQSHAAPPPPLVVSPLNVDRTPGIDSFSGVQGAAGKAGADAVGSHGHYISLLLLLILVLLIVYHVGNRRER